MTHQTRPDASRHTSRTKRTDRPKRRTIEKPAQERRHQVLFGKSSACPCKAFPLVSFKESGTLDKLGWKTALEISSEIALPKLKLSTMSTFGQYFRVHTYVLQHFSRHNC